MSNRVTPRHSPAPDALAYRIQDVMALTGLGGTKIYELMGAGILDARKAGTRTLIMADSVRAYIAGLPKAGVAERT